MADEEMTVSQQVIMAVAKATDQDPLELPALFHTIEPDALNTLIETMDKGEFLFDYAGEAVTITREGSATRVSL